MSFNVVMYVMMEVESPHKDTLFDSGFCQSATKPIANNDDCNAPVEGAAVRGP